jgi:CO dehydrogenase/acetyl-CoA synthase gamma subunit (corrinoid Fe-S protein)
MEKLYTIGMLKTAKNDPTVIADLTDGTINGYLHTVGSDGKADAPVAGDSTTAQSIDLRIALNDITGDNTYKDGVLIAKGEY